MQLEDLILGGRLLNGTVETADMIGRFRVSASEIGSPLCNDDCASHEVAYKGHKSPIKALRIVHPRPPSSAFVRLPRKLPP